MGYVLYRAVKQWAPADLTHREKLAAMVLADDALDETGITYSSVIDPEILRQAMIKSSREMYRILGRLVDSKVIEHVGGGHNGRVAKYRFLLLSQVSIEDVGGPETPPNSTEPDPVEGRETPPNAPAGRQETPGNDTHTEGEPGEKRRPTKRVGGRNPHRRAAKNATPNTHTPSTTSPTTGKPAAEQPAAKATKHAVADELTDAFWKIHGKGLAQSFIAVRGVVRTAIGNGVERDPLAHALDRVARDGKPISGGTLAFALGQARARPGGSVRDPIPDWNDPNVEVNL